MICTGRGRQSSHPRRHRMNAAHRPCLLASVLLAAAALVAPARGDDKADMVAAYERAKKLKADGKYAEAAGSFETALALAARVLGQDDVNTATIQYRLANTRFQPPAAWGNYRYAG